MNLFETVKSAVTVKQAAGYIFDRWDGDPTNVTENRTIDRKSVV